MCLTGKGKGKGAATPAGAAPCPDLFAATKRLNSKRPVVVVVEGAEQAHTACLRDLIVMLGQVKAVIRRGPLQYVSHRPPLFIRHPRPVGRLISPWDSWAPSPSQPSPSYHLHCPLSLPLYVVAGSLPLPRLPGAGRRCPLGDPLGVDDNRHGSQVWIATNLPYISHAPFPLHPACHPPAIHLAHALHARLRVASFHLPPTKSRLDGFFKGKLAAGFLRHGWVHLD